MKLNKCKVCGGYIVIYGPQPFWWGCTGKYCTNRQVGFSLIKKNSVADANKANPEEDKNENF